MYPVSGIYFLKLEKSTISLLRAIIWEEVYTLGKSINWSDSPSSSTLFIITTSNLSISNKSPVIVVWPPIKGNDIPINDHIGKLYKIDNNKKITIVESGLGIPNTFIWSPDNTKFYFTDTLDGNILKYEYELQEGKISNKKNFAKFHRGFPDGSTIDTDGCIWNCRYGGSCVVRFDPNGNVDQVFEMPVKNITNCIFGGNDMKTLFITTALNNGKDQHELDGSVFALNLNYEGLEDHQSKIEIK